MTQEQALKILKTGANVFLTGEPGSGKTYTINKYVEYLREHGISPAITASTGIAATHIGGMTLHSWSGIGIKKFLTPAEVEEVAGRLKLSARIEKTRVLIIDEVSMLDASTLDAAESICRKVKGNSHPWGGMQIVFVGDFFQLPPVSRAGEPLPRFAFMAESWHASRPKICYLSEQHRQADRAFLSLLAAIRSGEVLEESLNQLAARKIQIKDHADRTRLYTHNVDVDRINDQRLAQIPGTEQKFTMQMFGPGPLVDQLKRGCLSPEVLKLKVGAHVMFTKNNFEKGFANGTLGEVIEFNENEAPIVRTAGGEEILVPLAEWAISDGSRTLAKILQFPLRLAWAMTVHKSQGMTLDSALIDLARAFEYGQGYVALSRVKSLDGLFLLGWNNRALLVHPDVLNADGAFRSDSEGVEQMIGNLSAEAHLASLKEFILKNGGDPAGGKKITIDVPRKRKSKTDKSTYDETFELWKAGQDLDEMARVRSLTRSTIAGHLEELVVRGQIEVQELKKLLPPNVLAALPEITIAFAETQGAKLGVVYGKFNGRYTFDELRLARLLI